MRSKQVNFAQNSFGSLFLKQFTNKQGSYRGFEITIRISLEIRINTNLALVTGILINLHNFGQRKVQVAQWFGMQCALKRSCVRILAVSVTFIFFGFRTIRTRIPIVSIPL